MNFDEYFSKIFKIKFSLKEISSLILSTIIISVISSFRLWGDKNPDLSIGISNLFEHFVVNLSILFIFISLIKLYLIYYSTDFEYKYSKYGILATLLIVFGTNGYLSLYSPGYGNIIHNKNRLGKLFYRPRIDDYQRSLFFSSLVILILTYLIAPYNNLFFKQAMWILIFAILPIPHNFGFLSFYSNKKKHIILMLFILLSFITWNFFGFYFSLILSIILSLILVIFIFKVID